MDTALRRVSVTRTGVDRGKLLECAVFLALHRLTRDVFYWRGAGVDFVVQLDGKPIPIQVSWDGPTERHHRALDEFYEKFPTSHEAIFIDSEFDGQNQLDSRLFLL